MKDRIFEMYKSISVGNNQICSECNNEGALGKPVSIYFIGKNFHSSDDTILFVGKTAVGGLDVGPFVDDLFTDATAFGELSLDLKEKNAKTRAFYSYTNEIVTQYYGSFEIGKQFIALSNLVKCNNASTKDETSYHIMEHCINSLRVTWREIEILKPKRIIFYTGNTDYDDFIENFEPENYDDYFPIEGDRSGPWWHGRYVDENQVSICDILRINHPDRMRYIGGNAKENYISKVVDWLHKTK